MVFRTLDNRQGKPVISKSWEVGSIITQAHCIERVPRLWHRDRGPNWSLGGLPESRRWSWQFRETKVTRFHMAVYRGAAVQRENSRELQSSQLSNEQYIHVKNWRNNHLKWLEGTILAGHTALKIVPVSTSQAEKLLIHRALGGIHRKVLSQ